MNDIDKAIEELESLEEVEIVKLSEGAEMQTQDVSNKIESGFKAQKCKPKTCQTKSNPASSTSTRVLMEGLERVTSTSSPGYREKVKLHYRECLLSTLPNKMFLLSGFLTR